jgi:ADP-dependent NAD(P)H-hydrate dehydratase / NAD(P)H-hydrate epimerase
VKLYHTEAMRQADTLAVESGLPLEQLMENAGRVVAEAALRHFPAARQFLVLCGKGNNGGDGYVAARYLHQSKREVVILEQITELETLTTEEARQARESYISLQACYELSLDNLQKALPLTEVVIDALLGSGLSRALHEPLSSFVKLVNASHKPVLSIDVPSGVQSDSPVLTGEHIQATHTVQLAGAKIASVFYPAQKAFGSWEVADIGIPEKILQPLSEVQLLDHDTIKPWLPKREADVNKYTAGTVLVIAGSSRYLGAAELACRAAYRAGAGLVTLAAETRFPSSWPEIIFEALDWSKEPLEAINAIGEKRAQSRVIGPGLDEKAVAHLPALIAQSKVPTILDAGSLVMTNDWAQAIRAHGRCVLTPHYGEAAKLLGVSSTDIRAKPLEYAHQLAKDLKALVVLKGPCTLITNGKQTFISTRGHPGMATGGAGDVLAGFLGAWLTTTQLANTNNLFERTAATVYLHGLAGEYAAQRFNDGLIASDVLEAFPLACKTIQH